jgi:outer membrane protein assembly factor BamA
VKKQVFLVIILLKLAATVVAAIGPQDPFVIRSIILTGNKVTRPGIILRELTFREGDTLSAGSLDKHLVMSRENVFNTSLFNIVKIDTAGIPGATGELAVTVTVIERWYIWPMPYLEFPDHNLNAWLRDPLFSQLTYGVNLRFFNARGRNETLTVLLHFGYNQKYGFTYKTPYINRKKTWGFGFGANAGLNRTLQVANVDNQNVYLAAETGFLQQQYMGYLEVFHRPAWYLHHLLDLSYSYYIFADTLRSVGGFFAQDSSLEQGIFQLYYKIKFDKRDARYYPLEGYYADLELLKSGLFSETVDLFALKSTLKGYWKLARRWHAASGVTARASFPQEQPFYLQEGLGYGRDYIRGYDAYIITGQHFLISKNNLKFSIIPQRVLTLSFIDTPKFSVLPIALYANLFTDLGYVWNPDPAQSGANPLTNSFLLGYGLGLDLATYYDVVIGLNFSLNIQGTPGFFIHFIAPI